MSLQEVCAVYRELYAERPRKLFLDRAARAHPLLALIRADDVEGLRAAAGPECANERIRLGKSNEVTPFAAALWYRAYYCLDYLIGPALDFGYRCEVEFRGERYAYCTRVHAAAVLGQPGLAPPPLLQRYLQAERALAEDWRPPTDCSFLEQLFLQALERRGAEPPADFSFLEMVQLFALRQPGLDFFPEVERLQLFGRSWERAEDAPFGTWAADRCVLHEADPQDCFVRLECAREALAFLQSSADQVPQDRPPVSRPAPRRTGNESLDRALEASGLLDERRGPLEEPVLAFLLRRLRGAPDGDLHYLLSSCRAAAVRAIFELGESWEESAGPFVPVLHHKNFLQEDSVYLFDRLRLLHLKYQEADANEYRVLYTMLYFGALEGFPEHLFDAQQPRERVDSAANCLALLYLCARRRLPLAAVPGRHYDVRLDRYATAARPLPLLADGRPHSHGHALEPWKQRFRTAEWGSEAWYRQSGEGWPEWMAPVRCSADLLSPEELATHELYEELWHCLLLEDYEGAEMFVRGCAHLDRTNRYGSLLQNAFMVLSRRAFAFLHAFGRIPLTTRNWWGQTLTFQLLEAQSLWHLQVLYPQLAELQTFPGRQQVLERIANL